MQFIAMKTNITLTLEEGPVEVMKLKRGKGMQIVRGAAISMIFQEPMASFASSDYHWSTNG